MLERLQKIIARAGISSRRHAEELITSGLVTVNGRVITELGTKADPARDHIKVSGKLLRPPREHVCLLFNKPPEVVSTLSDPEGRRSLQDYLHGIPERVFPVGRLEYHASGLQLLTNDGDIANRILKSRELRQIYHLKLKTLLTLAETEALARSTGARIQRLRGRDNPWYEVTLTQARSDTLRNRLFQSGHPVDKMIRVGLANLGLDSLPPGASRPLTPEELSGLSRALRGAAASPGKASQIGSRKHWKPRPARSRRKPGSLVSSKERR
jgi:23S rRNA pseudouridine2605 synthase